VSFCMPRSLYKDRGSKQGAQTPQRPRNPLTPPAAKYRSAAPPMILHVSSWQHQPVPLFCLGIMMHPMPAL
jgi:hypothetical protein